MRFTLLVAFIIYFSVSLAQDFKPTPPDSLKYFSYFMFAMNDGYENPKIGVKQKIINATCFFVKDGKRTFLVTAKHCFSSCNIEDTLKHERFPDTIYIKLKSKKSNQYELYPIYARIIADTITCEYNYKSPDVFVYEFKDADKYYINNITPYIVEPSILDSVWTDEIYSAGYPYIDVPTFEELMTTPASLIKVKEVSKLRTVLKRSDGKYDPINYEAILDTGYFAAGSSGSPVFIKSKAGYLYFGGLISAATTRGGLALFVKPEYVILKILDFLR